MKASKASSFLQGSQGISTFQGESLAVHPRVTILPGGTQRPCHDTLSGPRGFWCTPSAIQPPKSSEAAMPNLHAPANPQHQRWRGQMPGGRNDNINPNRIFLSSKEQPACAFKFFSTQKALQWFTLAGL